MDAEKKEAIENKLRELKEILNEENVLVTLIIRDPSESAQKAHFVTEDAWMLSLVKKAVVDFFN